MKISKKLVLIIILIAALAISAGITIRKVTDYRSYYKSIDKATKERVMSVLNKSIGQSTGLNTYQLLIEWISVDEQTAMMDKILASMKVIGEAKNGKPLRYIEARYADMIVYIPYDYNEESPATKIVLQVDEHYYIVSSNKKYVNIVVDYMNKAFPFKPKSD